MAEAVSGGVILLDDGSGRLPVSAGALPPDNPLPSLAAGDYVVVVGRLLPGDPANPSPEALSVKAAKVCDLELTMHPARDHSELPAPGIVTRFCFRQHLHRVCMLHPVIPGLTLILRYDGTDTAACEHAELRTFTPVLPSERFGWNRDGDLWGRDFAVNAVRTAPLQWPNCR